MFAGRWFRVYIVPAAVFQSALVGGGYGTGREVVEYFSLQGVIGGLGGLIVAALVFGVILAATYEFSRRFNAYDYRHFFKLLIGPGWVAYEALYIVAVVLVLAIIGSATGDIFLDQLGWPRSISSGLLLILITAVTFYGRELVSRIMTFWAAFLSLIFVLYFVIIVIHYGPQLQQGLSSATAQSGWARKGLQFALYNVAMVPALLFSAREIQSRHEAISAGLIAAVAGILPALLFHLSFAARNDAVLTQALPTYWMISEVGANWLMGIYLIGLFGTLVQTGIGLIQGVIERIDAWCVERGRAPLTRPRHALLALTTILFSGLLSTMGIIALVAQGYGLLAWAFMLVYPLPLLTFGLVRMVRNKDSNRSTARIDP